MRVLQAVLIAVLVAGCAPAPDGASPRPASSTPSASAPASPRATTAPEPPTAATPPSPPPPAPTPAPPSSSVEPAVLVPLVPVTGFWAGERSITRAALAELIAGHGTRRVYVAAPDLAPLAATLGVTPGANVREVAPAKVLAAVAAAPTSLGILRPAHVTPAVRALAVDGAALYGVDRVRDVSAWPLRIDAASGDATTSFSPAGLWTMAAGGDTMLDRLVYRRTVIDGLGADYPWDGGTARVASTGCCGFPGWSISRFTATGSGGAVRAFLQRADIALVNLEGPAPADFRYHPHGLVFSMDPALLGGLARAGVDVVSIGNNHIRNWGGKGVVSTIRELDRRGIAHAGAGATATAAHRPAWLTAAGLRVAVLAYNGVGTAANAAAGSPGAAALTLATATADIRAARAAGADVVLVVPHWGAEYTDRLTAQQRSLGPALLRAGADAVIGGHSHWAGPIGLVDGRLIVYSMGDLVFDLVHDTRTQEGVLVELTFDGRRLAQVTLRPTAIVDAVQPAFLAPAAGGNALLAAIRRASRAAGMP